MYYQLDCLIGPSVISMKQMFSCSISLRGIPLLTKFLVFISATETFTERSHSNLKDVYYINFQ